MTHLALISPTSGSPTARMLRLLDKEIDALMGEASAAAKPVHAARAAAISECIQTITFDSLDDIKNVAMLRYEERSGEDETD